METHPIIDYESVAQAYVENLSVTLRGFGPVDGMTFLETWVPDDDPTPSILGIFEAAKQAGLSGITVRVAHQTLASIDLPLLESKSAVWGEPQFRTTPDISSLTLSFGIEDPFHGVNARYHSALAAAADSREFEGALQIAGDSDSILAISFYDHLRLMVLVRKDDHVVRKARYSGASPEVYRRLLELLCPILQDKPILQCSDHAIIELEFAMRDHSQPVPVPGVIMPENCDPIFAVPLRLVRDLLSDYRSQVAFDATENFYVRPCSPRWRDLSTENRRAEVLAAAAGFDGGSEVEDVTIEGTRVVVQFAPGITWDAVGSQLLRLERHLQQTVEPTLQVHLPAKSDLNSIRRIKEVRN